MQSIETIITDLLSEALKRAYDLERPIQIETPKDESHGDFSTNVAMTLAKPLKNNPRSIAQTIVDALGSSDYVDRVEIAGPGFINFYVANAYYHRTISAVLAQGDAYGQGTLENPHSINIEYCSVNPTGAIHVGHARGAAAGDSLSRIMRKAGYSITREYYVNDAGNQIINLARSIQARYEQLHGTHTPIPEDGYRGEEITAIAQAIKTQHGDQFLGTDATEFFKAHGVKKLLEGIKQDLRDFGVEFDVFYSEQSLYDNGDVDEALSWLEDNGFTYEESGATFLKTSHYGDEKDRVLIKTDGTNTYLVPDIAYHKTKLDRGFDTLIDILGSDHHGYVSRLKAAIEMFTNQSDKLEVDMLQLVRVLQDGEEVKMSKRSGRAINLRDLIEEAGRDAVRYFFARHSLNTHMDLDLDLAIKNSTDNPVYYAQYAHARLVTLINKARAQGYSVDETIDTYASITSHDGVSLMKWLSRYPSVIAEAAKKRQVHKVTNYIHSLAGALHSFYSNVPVIKADAPRINEHLNLMHATRIVIKDALSLIGVDAPERM